MAYVVLRRPWRLRKPYMFLMIPELGLVIALLVLFGLSQPNAYRTTMWQIGYENGFNSNPSMILYAYANHAPLPHIPFVWSQTITNFNVAISVLSLFILLAKMVTLIMHVFYPVIGTFVITSMIALYVTSIAGQAGPDHADPRYPSSVAWYIAKSCDYAKSHNAVSDCLMAKGSFAVTVLMLFLYLVQLGIAIYSLLPNKELDIKDDGSDSEDGFPAPASKQWEMQPRPMLSPRSMRSPRTHNPNIMSSNMYSGGISDSPFTPRTEAFHALDRKLPLRS